MRHHLMNPRAWARNLVSLGFSLLACAFSALDLVPHGVANRRVARARRRDQLSGAASQRQSGGPARTGHRDQPGAPGGGRPRFPAHGLPSRDRGSAYLLRRRGRAATGCRGPAVQPDRRCGSIRRQPSPSVLPPSRRDPTERSARGVPPQTPVPCECPEGPPGHGDLVLARSAAAIRLDRPAPPPRERTLPDYSLPELGAGRAIRMRPSAWSPSASSSMDSPRNVPTLGDVPCYRDPSA